MKQHIQRQQNRKRSRSFGISGAVIVMLLLGAMLFCGGCSTGENGKESVTGTPAGTEAPVPTEKPKNWMLRLLADGRTELSMPVKTGLEKDAWLPVSVSKTVRLGDFEYVITVPQTNFRLSDLQDGTDALEIIAILRYVGEKDGAMIAYEDGVFVDSVTDPSGNMENSGRYDREIHGMLKKGEEIYFRKIYGEFSRKMKAAGAGVIVMEVEFAVLDENEERTGEDWDYLLAVSFDVAEK